MQAIKRLITTFAVLSVLFSISLADAQLEKDTKGFNILGSIYLQPVEGTLPKISLLNFFSAEMDEDEQNAHLSLFRHYLLFELGLKNKIAFVSRNNIESALKEEQLGEADPLDIPHLRKSVTADYFIHFEEYAKARQWFWRARIFNGRSGAFSGAVETKRIDNHTHWTTRNLLKKLVAFLNNEEPPKEEKISPSYVITKESLMRFHALTTACRNDRCLSRISDLEWIKAVNPQFYESIVKNSRFTTEMMKASQTPYDMARIDILEERPLDVSIKLENKLKRLTYTKDKIRYLELIGKAALALEREEKTQETFETLQRLDRFNPEVALGLSWLAMRKNNREEAIDILERQIRHHSARHITLLKALLRAYEATENEEGIQKTKRLIAEFYENLGNYALSNEYYMQLLENRFDMALLDHLRLNIMKPLMRQSLLTMLNAQEMKSGKQDARVYRNIAKIHFIESRTDEGMKVVQGALKIHPKDTDLLMMAAWDALLRNNDLPLAEKYFNRLSSWMRKRYPLFQALLYERSGRFEKALKAWKRLSNDTAWHFESKLNLAAITLKMKQYEQAIQRLDEAQNIYSGRDEIFRMRREAYLALDKKDKATREMVFVYQLAGKPIEHKRVEGHLLRGEYRSLILPHPLVSWRQGRIETLGKVLLLNGTPLPIEEGWKKYLHKLTPYKKRFGDRFFHEIESVLEQRYSIARRPEFEEMFRKRLNPKALVNQSNYTQLELIEIATKQNVDSIAIVTTVCTPNLETERTQAKVILYLFDGLSNSIYSTNIDKTLPLFDVYRFNVYLAAIPLFLFFIIFLFYRKLSKAIKYWANPLLKAQALVDMKKFKEAYELLESKGYKQDANEMLGHYYASRSEFLEAMQAFYRAGDANNALEAMKGLKDNPKAYILGADIYLKLKEYDRAEALYKKAKNYIGIAKVYEAQDDKKKAARIMGQYYFEQGNPAAAVEEYRKIDDYDRAGWVKYYHGEYREAEELFKQSGNRKMLKRAKLKAQQEG